MEHSHNHTHQHSTTKNMGLAFILNFSFAIFEFFGGIYTNSIAITSDALHDFGDSLSIGLSWYFEKVAKRKRNHLFTYGYKRFSILGALINSLVLLVGATFVLLETVPRLFSPVESNAQGMFWFAIIGVAVNGFAVLRLKQGNSLGERVISLHLLEDVLGWLAVLVGSILMYFFDIPIIDPILSLGITGYILINVYKNLKSVAIVILQAKPQNLSSDEIEKDLTEIQGVEQIHDLHIWTMDSQYNILSVHAVISKNTDTIVVKSQIRKRLHEHYGIEHITIELELAGEDCGYVEC